MLPKNILTHTVDSLYAIHRVHTNLIYIALLVALCIGVALLPVVRVAVTIQSPAVIRSSTEKATLYSPVGGIVEKSYVKQNALVKRSDTLYVIGNKILLEKEHSLSERALILGNLLDDIRALVIWLKKTGSIPFLKTDYFKQTLSQFQQKEIAASLDLKRIRIEFDRSHKLHEQNVIADAEFEEKNFLLTKAVHELNALTVSQLNQLRTEELAYIKEFNDIQFQRAEIQKEKEPLTIKAPCSGTVIITHVIYPGSSISVGMALMDISPNTNLITEVYVSPRDVGLVQQNMSVAFQVDAFDHNDWGYVSGAVIEISDDAVVVGDLPAFIVRCSLNRDYLQLKNGYKGFLKKGMSVRAHFQLAERSIWQLLFDKVDDWINPQMHQAL